jgi:hypothetical protein
MTATESQSADEAAVVLAVLAVESLSSVVEGAEPELSVASASVEESDVWDMGFEFF